MAQWLPLAAVTAQPMLAALLALAAATLLLILRLVKRGDRRVGRQVGTVTDLFIYPIKSCRGIRMQEWDVYERGFQFDRLWQVVDSENRFMTQRDYPTMCFIGTALSEDRKTLTVTAPDMPELNLPVDKVGPELSVVVWSATCQAYDMGAAAAEWFTKYLQRPCKLVRMADGFRRETEPKFAAGYETGFADGFPFLMISENSLEELNARLPAGEGPMKMNRFRPNIVVRASRPFEEDSWASVRVGDLTLRAVKPCSRCNLTTTNQETAVQTRKEPLKSLRQFRTGIHIGSQEPSFRQQVFFGQNLVAEQNTGSVRVGDAITLLEGRQ